ncbi:MAG: LysM domain-containing protein [Actinomycetota bacterium]|nr:LysM domain-containing protein [Actinomycetota bacterium]
MVAVLRAELEEFETDYIDDHRGPQLHLVAGVPEHLLRGAEMMTNRCSSATYWRRRLTCLALLMGAAWLTVSALSGSPAIEQPSAAQRTVFETAAGETLAAGQIVIVKPGDTLWSIARQLQPTGDLRPLVDRIAKINNGHSLIAGQALLLP